MKENYLESLRGKVFKLLPMREARDEGLIIICLIILITFVRIALVIAKDIKQKK